MSTLELQEKIIAKIKSTKEDYVLEEVYRLLEFEENSGPVYKLSAEQKRLIDMSIREIENGEFSTDEDVQKESEEWLKK